MLDKVIEKITEQQKGKENTAVFFCGEQLKDIIKAQPEAAEIVLQDLEKKEMSIIECEKKIKALADKRHKEQKGNSAFVSPVEAEGIIRKFYGIPDKETSPVSQNIDLSDFLL